MDTPKVNAKTNAGRADHDPSANNQQDKQKPQWKQAADHTAPRGKDAKKLTDDNPPDA